MAEPTNSPDWAGFINGLSPQLQGIVLFGAAIGGGIYLGRRYLKRLMIEPPEPKVFAAGEPTSFTDMKPIRDLLENVNLLTLQAMKIEVGVSSLIEAFQEAGTNLNKSIEKVADIAGQLMLDMREQRQEEADEARRLEYIEEGKRLAREEIANKRRAKSRPSRAKPRPKRALPKSPTT